MILPFEIHVWSQMFFDDGSVSQPSRVLASGLDRNEFLDEEAARHLKSTNRQEGSLLIWGAGNMIYKEYSTSSLEESSS